MVKWLYSNCLEQDMLTVLHTAVNKTLTIQCELKLLNMCCVKLGLDRKTAWNSDLLLYKMGLELQWVFKAKQRWKSSIIKQMKKIHFHYQHKTHYLINQEIRFVFDLIGASDLILNRGLWCWSPLGFNFWACVTWMKSKSWQEAQSMWWLLRLGARPGSLCKARCQNSNGISP